MVLLYVDGCVATVKKITVVEIAIDLKHSLLIKCLVAQQDLKKVMNLVWLLRSNFFCVNMIR